DAVRAGDDRPYERAAHDEQHRRRRSLGDGARRCRRRDVRAPRRQTVADVSKAGGPPMTLRNKAVIVGVGESDIGKLPHMTGLGLNAQAAKRALDDAGLKPSDIDGLLTAYSFTEPYFMLGTVLAEYLGLQPTYCASMVVGGASPAIMLHHAAMA